MTAHDLAHDPGRRTGRADWTAACVYLAPKVLIVDVGYVLLDELGTSVVFQLISARYERGSVILASDKSYGIGARSSARRAYPTLGRPPVRFLRLGHATSTFVSRPLSFFDGIFDPLDSAKVILCSCSSDLLKNRLWCCGLVVL